MTIALPIREYRDQIHKQLVANADKKTQEKVLRLVRGAKVIGLTVPKLRALVSEFRRAWESQRDQRSWTPGVE